MRFLFYSVERDRDRLWRDSCLVWASGDTWECLHQRCKWCRVQQKKSKCPVVFIPRMHTRLRCLLSIISGLLRLTCLSDRLFTSFDPIWETWTHSSLPHGCVRVSVLPAPGFSVAAAVWEAPWPTLSPQSALEVQGSTLWWISKEIACVFLHSPAGSQPHPPSGDSVVAKHGALRSAVGWSIAKCWPAWGGVFMLSLSHSSFPFPPGSRSSR